MGAEQPSIEKALQLLLLLADNRYLSNQEICARFGFTERTLYRYVSTFREAGFAVKKVNNGAYRLETTANKASKQVSELVQFSEEDAFLLHEAIDSIEPSTLRREKLRKNLYAVYDYKVLALAAVEKQNQKIVSKLMDAIECQIQVLLKDYRSAHSGTTTDRWVEPFRFTDAMDQIWCYEMESESVKTFKISRIGDVEFSNEQWMHKDRHESGFVDIFRMHSKERFPVKLKLSMRAASLLMEEYPLSKKYLKNVDSGKYILETEVCGFEGITRFILGLYEDIVIIGSDDLKAYVKYKVRMLNK